MKNNEILLIYGENYKEMAKSLAKKASLAAMIGDTNKRIGIKPNLVDAYPADSGATTHPEIAAGLIEYLQENDFHNLVILEGAWVGGVTSECFDVCGYKELSDSYGVELFDTQKDASVKMDCAGLELNICKEVKDLDFLINVPVLKGHCQTRMTCALKNMKGLIPNSEKRRFHSLGLHKPIAHLSAGIHQDFIIVDGICGDWDFEDGGNPVVMNRMYACTDPVLCDAFGCELLKRNADDVEYIGLAEELGLGSKNVSGADIIELNRPEKDLPDVPVTNKLLRLSEKAEEVESCSACYAYLIPALDMLDQEGLLDQLQEKICIGQGYRGQDGELGIGSCTSCFRHSLSYSTFIIVSFSEYCFCIYCIH